MEQDFDKLKSEMEEKVKETFELAPFFHHNLNNFAHRYFDAPSESSEVEQGVYLVSGRNDKLKCTYSLGVKVLSFNSSRGGEVLISSEIKWDSPRVKKPDGSPFKKEEVFKFEDILILRNKLALKLETVCELFPTN